MKFCSSCGTKMVEVARFCPRCGKEQFQQLEEAIKWLGMLADKGDAEAQYKLAQILADECLKNIAACQKQGYSKANNLRLEIEKKLAGLAGEIREKNESISGDFKRQRRIDAFRRNRREGKLDESIITNQESSLQLAKETENRKKVKVGRIIEVGSYPQTANGEIQPIEWQVLEVKDGKALIISKYGLDARPFNKEYEATSWEECALRRWLNAEFYSHAFSGDEKARIIDADIMTEINTKYGVSFKYCTKDRIFLLDAREAYKLFSSDEARKCFPTEYAIKKGAYTSNGCCFWWLRSSGRNNCHAAHVYFNGNVVVNGRKANNVNDAVRPALWINL